jgi:hypothetical protein
MSKCIELHIIDSIKEKLIFDVETANIIISSDFLHKQMSNDICSIYIDCVSHNPQYQKYENNINVRQSGLISLFINGKVKTKLTNDKSKINQSKFEYANYILSVLETIEITNLETILFDKYTIKYLTNLQNPRLAFSFDTGDGEADFGINFEAYYNKIN